MVEKTLFIADLKVHNIIGGYDDYKRYINEKESINSNQKSQIPINKKTEIIKQTSNKLSYKHQRLLEVLPQEINKLEEEITNIHKILENDQFLYIKDQKTFDELSQKLIHKQKLVEEKTIEWMEIEELKSTL